MTGLFSSFSTAVVSFAGLEKESANSGVDGSTTIFEFSNKLSTAKNQTFALESVLSHLERARNAIGADAAVDALAEIDAAQSALTDSIQNSTNIISNITGEN